MKENLGRGARTGLARELSRGVVLVALAGSSIGGLLAAVALAARVLGR
jgi:hypothetical protein